MSVMMMSSGWISLNSFFTEIWAVNWGSEHSCIPLGLTSDSPWWATCSSCAQRHFLASLIRAEGFCELSGLSHFFFENNYSGLVFDSTILFQSRESEEQRCPCALVSCRTDFLWFLFREGFQVLLFPALLSVSACYLMACLPPKSTFSLSKYCTPRSIIAV